MPDITIRLKFERNSSSKDTLDVPIGIVCVMHGFLKKVDSFDMIEITESSNHIPFTDNLCSCGQTFSSRSNLLDHVDKHLPPEIKKKQFELFEK